MFGDVVRQQVLIALHALEQGFDFVGEHQVVNALVLARPRSYLLPDDMIVGEQGDDQALDEYFLGETDCDERKVRSAQRALHDRFDLCQFLSTFDQHVAVGDQGDEQGVD
ncbi:hypothetical protein AWU82_28400 [Pseudomonas glycinae]|uniref:Uncharacterized protein n=1 Tax=Pseudomonas glycinae TaxID=1785145 RepID=A0ABM6QHG9_9PSED|nr:hypothetical protein [Pseudomonas glycinae]AUG97407.1 hypothetical protein AWU82_28400 [Pseudomonas glycinae]